MSYSKRKLSLMETMKKTGWLDPIWNNVVPDPSNAEKIKPLPEGGAVFFPVRNRYHSTFIPVIR